MVTLQVSMTYNHGTEQAVGGQIGSISVQEL